MKRLAHLALAAALMASSAAGAATILPTTAAAAEQPWAIITYVRDGKPVGNTQLFCSGNDETWGDTSNYDYVVWTYYSMCP